MNAKPPNLELSDALIPVFQTILSPLTRGINGGCNSYASTIKGNQSESKGETNAFFNR
jgi:hypothetical protein